MTDTAPWPREITAGGLTISVDLPDEWQAQSAGAAVPFMAARPDPVWPEGRPLVLALTFESDVTTLGAWQDRVERALSDTLLGYHLLDLQDASGAWSAYRLASCSGGPTDPITLEQWIAVIGSVGATLTLSGCSVTYPGWSSLATELVKGVMVRG